MRLQDICFAVVFGLSLLAPTVSQAQHKNLQSGPMVGYTDMMEVLLWVQTKQEATVAFEYWETTSPKTIFKTDFVRTEKGSGFTAKGIADKVLPGRTYQYRLVIDNKPVTLPYPTEFKTQTLWQWRTDPPPFSMATGSCAYTNDEPYDRPGKPYGADSQIFTSIHAKKPDLMLWLGDNVYLREVDWFTKTGMLYRYTQARSQPELQPLLASTSHYAIWDDHDFGPNDSDGSFVHKDMSRDVFKNFWGNPTYGFEDKRGITTFFQYADVEFFLLDDRYFRTANRCESCPDRMMLGKQQLEWLKEALAASYAPFKVIACGGQVLTTNKASETYINLYPAERDSILAHIEREDIKGVVFLTGDRHFSELSAMKNARGNWVYDLTVSPLSAGPYATANETVNDYRVEGTLVGQRNFAMLNFSGPRKSREMKIDLYDSNGQPLWTRTIGPDGTLK